MILLEQTQRPAWRVANRDRLQPVHPDLTPPL